MTHILAIFIAAIVLRVVGLIFNRLDDWVQ